MFKKSISATLIVSLLSFFSLKADICCDDIPICEENLSFFPGHPVTFWASYTPFDIHDGRNNGLGTTCGQSTTFGVSYGLNPCVSFDVYGVYESSRTRSQIFTPVPDVLQRTISRTNGWGGGAQLNVLLPFAFTGYINGAYVSIHQKLRTIDLTETEPDVFNRTDGHRWQGTLGLNYVYPFDWVTFGADFNYLFVSNHLAGFVNPATGDLSSQNSRYGTLTASGVAFFFPNCWVSPLVNGAVGYDIHRREEFPLFTPSVDILPPRRSTFPLRNRFEWNLGAGVIVKYYAATFAFVYQHKRRAGPIKTDMITVYGSIVF